LSVLNVTVAAGRDMLLVSSFVHFCIWWKSQSFDRWRVAV